MLRMLVPVKFPYTTSEDVHANSACLCLHIPPGGKRRIGRPLRLLNPLAGAKAIVPYYPHLPVAYPI